MTAATPEWVEQAKCRGLNSLQANALFFPEDAGRSASEPGKRFCNGTDDRQPCPVRSQCLQLALDTDTRYGIWGGISERGRREMHRTVARDQRQARDEPA